MMIQKETRIDGFSRRSTVTTAERCTFRRAMEHFIGMATTRGSTSKKMAIIFEA
jgi:hypothetical protein